MFRQFSIKQMMVATLIFALLFALIATGIQQENPMAGGFLIALAILPTVFLVYALVTILGTILCNLGTRIFGPIAQPGCRTATAPTTTTDAPVLSELTTPLDSSTAESFPEQAPPISNQEAGQP